MSYFGHKYYYESVNDSLIPVGSFAYFSAQVGHPVATCVYMHLLTFKRKANTPLAHASCQMILMMLFFLIAVSEVRSVLF